MKNSTRLVATPAGKCSIKLNSTNYEDVIEWTRKVHTAGLAEGINYLPSAFTFFVRQFYEIFSEDHKIVCEQINSAYNVDKKNTYELIGKINLEEKQNKIEKKKRREQAEKEELLKKKQKILNPLKPIQQKSPEVKDKIKIKIKRK